MIIDGFAGPGGWSEGLRLLGLRDVGLEFDTAACRTRAKAFEQVGNAVPPLLAAHVVSAATGIPIPATAVPAAA